MDILWGVLLLAACWLGYKMGNRDRLVMELPTRMRKAVRSEEQEAMVIEKIHKGNKING